MSTPDTGTEHHETQTEVARKDCPVDPDGDLEDPNNLVRAKTMDLLSSGRGQSSVLYLSPKFCLQS